MRILLSKFLLLNCDGHWKWQRSFLRLNYRKRSLSEIKFLDYLGSFLAYQFNSFPNRIKLWFSANFSSFSNPYFVFNKFTYSIWFLSSEKVFTYWEKVLEQKSQWISGEKNIYMFFFFLKFLIAIISLKIQISRHFQSSHEDSK